MSDEIWIKLGEIPPRIPAESDPAYVKHINCEGARFHVPSWDTKGRHCSEPDCIHNKPNKTLHSQTESEAGGL